LLKADNELIAANARYRIGLTHGIGKPAGNRLQQAVAGFVAIAIVNRLELVEVQVDYPEFASVAVGAGDTRVQAFTQQCTVGQVGQLVMFGAVGQLLFLVAALGGR
jgi:hypothetical protein